MLYVLDGNIVKFERVRRVIQGGDFRVLFNTGVSTVQCGCWVEWRTIRAIQALLFTGDGESHLEGNVSFKFGLPSSKTYFLM